MEATMRGRLGTRASRGTIWGEGLLMSDRLPMEPAIMARIRIEGPKISKGLPIDPKAPTVALHCYDERRGF